LGEAEFHLVLGEEALGLRGAGLFVEVGVAVEDELGRLHEKLGGGLAGVQRDQLKLGELFEIEV
jgi:hypothetical protein